MTDTPRTDAQIRRYFLLQKGKVEAFDHVHADFARTLERKLAARDAEMARLQAAIDELVAARNEWAYSDDDYEHERLNIAFSVARSLATKPK